MKIVRVQLDVPEQRIEELNALMEETGIATRKDLINNALTLFEWAVSTRRQGKKIGSINEEDCTFQELLMPAIEASRPS